MASVAFEKPATSALSRVFTGFVRISPASCYIPSMLFMVIEHFKDGDPKPILERFVRDGRMLPEGVVYHASWIDPASAVTRTKATV